VTLVVSFSQMCHWLTHAKSRNQSSDVWSLGCVFLEMGTVLNNRTVDEMRSYFETHGSRGPYVRGNREAANMWLEELKQSSKCVDDMQPVHLSLDMCQEDPDQRPTAAQVVSEILDFQGEAPYCGHCCDSENGTLRLVNNEPTEKGRFLENSEAEDSSESLSAVGSTDNPSGTLINTALDEKGRFLENNEAKDSSESLSAVGSTENPSGTLINTALDEKGGLSVSQDLSPDHNQRNSPEAQSSWRQPTVEDYEGTVRLTYDPSSPEVNDNSEVESDGDRDRLVPPLSPNSAESEISRSRMGELLKWCAHIYPHM
jgi:serine/threonine protein kinase